MHAPPRKKRNSTQVNLIISVVFHVLVIGALFFFAAREGMLGQKLKTIAVQMAPKEKPPEKKPEEKKPEEPKVEPPKPKPVEPPKVTPKMVSPPKPPPPQVAVAPRPAVVAPPPAVVAPPAMVGGFNFTDASAKTVQSSSDPVLIYKGFVEYALRSKWSRPVGVDDLNFIAEVDVTIDPTGRITSTDWRKGSGDSKWDDSVKRALRDTTTLTRPPPKNFPAKVLVRFDTVQESEPVTALDQ
ncbi:MAG: TonB C-terminal domain-containing protein [Verrucomicrobia bacterium]|nr:TonB C-terminal domain-containing protein [Verrucomicrobiota bacterium]NBU07619.1 TonB C-terminal domain-containing protein [Pseudomonadota bacterium]NDA68716.1 TonB C-terminal domain-containing protein [Verrucomicrobiota bacterium]NDB75473.1 TonB C-terminal domain-containing protein [Verrucomicrobiota bacterium]NDD40456.1 TonB C-terminal domain-containing protein [Verrucomicrobiota bacterium]